MAHIIIVAKVVAQQQFITTVKAEMLKLIAPTRKEVGCIEYTLHQDNQNPAVFVFYETWESAAAIAEHIGSEHYKAYARALEGLLEDKIVNKMTRIA